MMNTKNLRHSRQFTVFELLVVVSVTMLLFAIIMPAFRAVMQRVETAACGSNLRQLSIGVNLFADDNRGDYPDPWRWVWSDGSKGSVWDWVEWAEPDTVPRGTLFPYISDVRVYLCPVFKRVACIPPQFSHLTPYVGYSLNEYMQSPGVRSTWAGRPKVNRTMLINTPMDEFGLLADEGTVVIKEFFTYPINNLCIGVGSYKPRGKCDGIAAFHNAPYDSPTTGKANVAFADGHVSLVGPASLYEVLTPAFYKK